MIAGLFTRDFGSRKENENLQGCAPFSPVTPLWARLSFFGGVSLARLSLSPTCTIVVRIPVGPPPSAALTGILH